MKKLLLGLLSITILFIAGCSGQEVIHVVGDSDNWKSRIDYEIGKHEQIGKGSIEYVGSDSLDNVSYAINYPEWFGVGVDGNFNDLSESGETDFPIRISLPDNHIDRLREDVENISITINWENVSGEHFEETIDFSTP